MNGIEFCDTRAGLRSINTPDTELVIWQRSLATGLQDWIDRTDFASLPDVRILAKPDEIRPALEPELDDCGLRAGDMRDRLVADVTNLAVEFADVTKSDYIDVRLERVSHDACWKFHRDSVDRRLVTTYCGPLTEWVRHEHAQQAIDQQREFEGPLERLGSGDVAIFKGNRTGPHKGIVHRSPPIAGTGLTRLLLCLNQQTDTSPDPWA